MNPVHFSGICKLFGGKLKERWGTLSGDFSMEVAGRVQAQRAVARWRADRQLAEFMSRNRNWWDLSAR